MAHRFRSHWLRLAPSILWLIAIYIVTALAEDFTPPPDTFWARVLFELQHIVAHAFVYAVQTALLIAALDWQKGAPRSDTRLLIGLILLLGLGQEALQTLMRAQLSPVGSPFDLLVDTSSAALTVYVYSRMQRRRLERRAAPVMPLPTGTLPNE